MKVKVKYCIPILTFETGETEIEIKCPFYDLQPDAKVEILERIAEEHGDMTTGMANALEVGYAYLKEVTTKEKPATGIPLNAPPMDENIKGLPDVTDDNLPPFLRKIME